MKTKYSMVFSSYSCYPLDCYIGTLQKIKPSISNYNYTVVVFGFSEAIKTVGESEGSLLVTVTQSRVIAQSFTLIASPVAYSENLPLPPDFPFAPPYDPTNPNNATRMTY